jgi:hypothetical protein
MQQERVYNTGLAKFLPILGIKIYCKSHFRCQMVCPVKELETWILHVCFDVQLNIATSSKGYKYLFLTVVLPAFSSVPEDHDGLHFRWNSGEVVPYDASACRCWPSEKRPHSELV